MVKTARAEPIDTNRLVSLAIRDYFDTNEPIQSQNDGPIYQAFMAAVWPLQTQGLNDLRQTDNPFNTLEALERLKHALLDSKVRTQFFPNQSEQAVRAMLDGLSLSGKPNVARLYSHLAVHVIEALHQRKQHSSFDIVFELSKRLESQPKSSSLFLINALTSKQAGMEHERYLHSKPYGSLISQEATDFFEKHIKYETNTNRLEEILNNLESIEPFESMSRMIKTNPTDYFALIRRTKGCLQFQCSIEASRALRLLIQSTNSPSSLPRLELELEHLKEAQTLHSSNSDYSSWHPIIIKETIDAIDEKIKLITTSEAFDIDTELDDGSLTTSASEDSLDSNDYNEKANSTWSPSSRSHSSSPSYSESITLQELYLSIKAAVQQIKDNQCSAIETAIKHR